MDLESYRKSLGLTQAAFAKALGLRSKGSISMIESGARPASFRLALKIQNFSEGAVSASTLRPDIDDAASPADGL